MGLVALAEHVQRGGEPHVEQRGVEAVAGDTHLAVTDAVKVVAYRAQVGDDFRWSVLPEVLNLAQLEDDREKLILDARVE